jgi:hypothetical protein
LLEKLAVSLEILRSWRGDEEDRDGTAYDRATCEAGDLEDLTKWSERWFKP